MLCCRIVNGIKNKNIKKSLGAKCTSLRQMRSIPLCSKAVFYVFVFDSIHDSVTMHGVSHHLASPMAATAFVSVPIGGFSTES